MPCSCARLRADRPLASLLPAPAADRPWIRALEAWLREAATRSVRILGQCFGAQVVAQALGGRVGPNPDGGFVLGVEMVQLAEPLRRSAALRLAAADVAATAAAAHGNSSGVGDSARVDSAATAGGMGSIAHVRIIQSHGDQVLQLPPGAVLLAASPTAPIEMFAAAGGNILAVQGHAELSAEETIQKILSAVAAAGRLSAGVFCHAIAAARGPRRCCTHVLTAPPALRPLPARRGGGGEQAKPGGRAHGRRPRRRPVPALHGAGPDRRCLWAAQLMHMYAP